jgi:alcohol dehydrogenase (cytochrome c)
MWSYRLATPPLAGLISTAGNLVITGETNGNLIVLDAKTGALLFRDSLGAGALDGGLIT